MLAILLSIAIVIAATALLMGIYSWFWQTKARRLQAAHPGAWVRPMIRYRSFFVVVLDTKEIKLVGLTGRPRHRHPRSELVARRSARSGSRPHPAAACSCASATATSWS